MPLSDNQIGAYNGCMDSDIEHLDFMPNGFKYMPCRHCSKPMLVGERKRKLPSHMECSLKAASDAMHQMAEKNGPYYDRWLASMARRFQEPPGGGGPPLDPPGDGTPLT